MATSSSQTPPLETSHVDTGLAPLRRLLDRRISEIAALSAWTERAMAAATTQRNDVYTALRRNAGTMRALLAQGTRGSLASLVRGLHDGLALHGERAQLEERIVSLRHRVEFLAQERALLEEVERAIGGQGSDENRIDLRGARLSQAARRIFHIVEDQHDALANDILDGPMQRLSDAAMDAELAGRVLTWDIAGAHDSMARARQATAEAAEALQERIERLWPVDSDRPLTAAVRRLLAESPLGERAHLRVIGNARRLSYDAELAAFRVVEAAVDNAVRRGHAMNAEVVMSYHRDRVVVVVKDDGEGFDVTATEARLGRMRGMGLIEMHERALIAGGRLEVRSQTGAGTEVHLTLPVPS